MVKVSLDKICKAVEKFLKTHKCTGCKNKIEYDKDEIEWVHEPKNPNIVKIKIKCMKCGTIDKKNLKL